jgi:anti-anti-sigma factor
MEASFSDTTLIFTFDGDLISTNVVPVRAELIALLKDHPTATALVANFTRVGQVDSQGLNLLIGLYREAQLRKIPFRIENASPSVRRLFGLLNLNERFGVSAA